MIALVLVGVLALFCIQIAILKMAARLLKIHHVSWKSASLLFLALLVPGVITIVLMGLASGSVLPGITIGIASIVVQIAIIKKILNVSILRSVAVYAVTILLSLGMAILVRTWGFQAFKTPAGSMEPTLIVGDHFLVNKFIYGIRIPFTNKEIIPIESPRQFDVVVFRYPNDRSKLYVKRVIGIPLNKVQIINKKIYINDEPLNDPYGYYDDGEHIIPGQRDNFGPVVVPPHSYFVLGDNRDHSHDSRFWGFVDNSDLIGKAFEIYWSQSPDLRETSIRWDRLGKPIH